MVPFPWNGHSSVLEFVIFLLPVNFVDDKVFSLPTLSCPAIYLRTGRDIKILIKKSERLAVLIKPPPFFKSVKNSSNKLVIIK